MGIKGMEESWESLSAFLSSGRKSCLTWRSILDVDDAEDRADYADSFQLFRDLPWHGQTIYRLTGTRVAWLNPLLLLLMVLVIVGVSSARFAIILCTPPASWQLKCLSFLLLMEEILQQLA